MSEPVFLLLMIKHWPGAGRQAARSRTIGRLTFGILAANIREHPLNSETDHLQVFQCSPYSSVIFERKYSSEILGAWVCIHRLCSDLGICKLFEIQVLILTYPQLSKPTLDYPLHLAPCCHKRQCGLYNGVSRKCKIQAHILQSTTKTKRTTGLSPCVRASVKHVAANFVSVQHVICFYNKVTHQCIINPEFKSYDLATSPTIQ